MACPNALTLLPPRPPPHPALSRSCHHTTPRAPPLWHCRTGHMLPHLPSPPPPRSCNSAKAPRLPLSPFVQSLHAVIHAATRIMPEHRRYSASVASAAAPPTPSATTSPSTPSPPPVRNRTAVRRRRIAHARCATPHAHTLAAARRSSPLPELAMPFAASWPSIRRAADEACHMLPPLTPLSQCCHYHSQLQTALHASPAI